MRFRRPSFRASLAVLAALLTGVCAASCFVSAYVRPLPRYAVWLYDGCLDFSWYSSRVHVEDADADFVDPIWGGRYAGFFGREDDIPLTVRKLVVPVFIEHEVPGSESGTVYTADDYTYIDVSLWHVAGAIGLWSMFLFGVAHGHRFVGPGVCRGCGYPLKSVAWIDGQDGVCKCPECGALNPSVHGPTGAKTKR